MKMIQYFYCSIMEVVMRMLKKHWKTALIVTGATVQGILISEIVSGFHTNFDVCIAGEVPEPGSILLLGLGAMFLRREKKKNDI